MRTHFLRGALFACLTLTMTGTVQAESIPDCWIRGSFSGDHAGVNVYIGENANTPVARFLINPDKKVYDKLIELQKDGKCKINWDRIFMNVGMIVGSQGHNFYQLALDDILQERSYLSSLAKKNENSLHGSLKKCTQERDSLRSAARVLVSTSPDSSNEAVKNLGETLHVVDTKILNETISHAAK